MSKYKTIIGRAESIDIIDAMLLDVPAKTDTGAYGSSIHAINIHEIEKKNGKKALAFTLLGDHSSFQNSVQMEVTKYKKVIVVNSFGHKQERFKIDLKVKLAGKVFRAPFSLADRSKKTFPVLLGRTMLNNRFLVDTAIVNVDRSPLKNKLKEWLAKADASDDEEQI
jgi:hypothetical protein